MYAVSGATESSCHERPIGETVAMSIPCDAPARRRYILYCVTPSGGKCIQPTTTMRPPIGCAAAENVENEFDGDSSVSVCRPIVVLSVAAAIVNDVPTATVTIAPGAPGAFGSSGSTSARSDDQSTFKPEGSTPDGTFSDTVVVHMPSAVRRHGAAVNDESTA